MKAQTITELAALRVAAKQREDDAIAERREIDAALAAAVEGPDEGSASRIDGDYKITVTRKLTRKVDTEALQTVWAGLDKKVQDTFTWSAGINTKHLRALQELGASELTAASAFITTSPAAVSVKVEAITKE